MNARFERTTRSVVTTCATESRGNEPPASSLGLGLGDRAGSEALATAFAQRILPARAQTSLDPTTNWPSACRGAAHERNCCGRLIAPLDRLLGAASVLHLMRPSSRVMTAAELRSRLPQLRDTCQAAVVRQGRRTQEDRSLTAAGTCQIGGVRRKIRVVAVYAAIAIAVSACAGSAPASRPRLLPRRVPVLQPS